MKKLLLLAAGSVALSFSALSQGCPAGLFFSEYTEGSSFNKAIEIYNPLPYAVDLSDYNVELFTNGSPTVSATFVMAGVLNPGDTYVICNPASNAGILAIKDTTSGVINFNGDDAFILKNNQTNDTLDIIGIVGVDPGTNWAVSTGATSEFTLVRMPNVAIGTTDWAVSVMQWNVLPQNDISNLGMHTFSAPTNSYNMLSSTICASDSLLFAGVYISVPGTYTDTLVAFSGCDSVVIMDLANYPTYLVQKDTMTCPGNAVFIGGANQTVAGTYYDNLLTVDGCDSIIEWTFDFYVEDLVSETAMLCPGDSIFLEGGWQTLDGVYTDVYTSVLTGCDSTVETTVTLIAIDLGVTQSGFDLTADQGGTATYQWLDCNTGIGVFGAWSQTFTPVFDGDYAVEITLDGCVDTSACSTVFGIGFEENSDLFVSVYPNPANELLNVTFNKQESVLIEILDLTGKIVYTYSSQVSPATLSLGALQPGVYLVRITAENNQSVHAFTKR